MMLVMTESWSLFLPRVGQKEFSPDLVLRIYAAIIGRSDLLGTVLRPSHCRVRSESEQADLTDNQHSSESSMVPRES